jgi:hypothetical protein
MTNQPGSIEAKGSRSIAAGVSNGPNFSGDIQGNVSIVSEKKREKTPQEKFADLLGRNRIYHKCDRTDQIEEFKTEFTDYADSRLTRPLIVLVHGDEDEEHDLVINRICDKELPELLSTYPNSVLLQHDWKTVSPKPHWKIKDYWEKFPEIDAPHSRGAQDTAGKRERILATIRQRASHLLVHVSLYETDFKDSGHQSQTGLFGLRRVFGGGPSIEKRITSTLDHLIEFWKEWPEIGNGQMVICLVRIARIPGRSRERPEDDWLKSWAKEHPAASDPLSPSLVVLTKLRPISDGDAKRWCEMVIKEHEGTDLEFLFKQLKIWVSELYQSNNYQPLPMRQLTAEFKNQLKSMA